jgi:hypothetical protein
VCVVSRSSQLVPASPARESTRRAAEKQQESFVLLRLVPSFPRRKRLYLIRHGESEWNRAQATLDALSMYAQVDHPLSLTGRQQAEVLAAKLLLAAGGAPSAANGATRRPPDGGGASAPWVPPPANELESSPRPTRFAAPSVGEAASALVDESEVEALAELCDAGLVLSSPLTRALQTCLLALGPVLRQRSQSVYLAPNARERINAGSADSFGTAIGADDVYERLIAKTTECVRCPIYCTAPLTRCPCVTVRRGASRCVRCRVWWCVATRRVVAWRRDVLPS